MSRQYRVDEDAEIATPRRTDITVITRVDDKDIETIDPRVVRDLLIQVREMRKLIDEQQTAIKRLEKDLQKHAVVIRKIAK